MSFADQVLALVRVLASQVTGDNAATTYNVTGFGGFRLGPDGSVIGDDSRDVGGEQAYGQEVFTGLGLFGRPLPPSDGIACEAIAQRTSDGLVTLAYRDLRLSKLLNPGGLPSVPAEGQLGIAGYGGGFLSFALTSGNVGSRRANIAVLYVPYAFDGDGVPGKAHVLAIDPTPGNSSITLVHGDGVFFTLTEDAGNGEPGIVWAASAESFGRITPSEVVVQCEKIMLKGNVYVGAQAELGAPLLPGPASPPCPSLFLSPV